MYRELAAYQQPRDLPMYRLLKVLENKDQTRAQVQAVPEVQAIPFADQAWGMDLSITVVSDRNATGVCSDAVWDASCEAVAGYMLAHMFNRHSLPGRCTCAMYDAVYPDLYWSTGFQISAMIKLESELQVREASRMNNFLPMLAKVWDVPHLQDSSALLMLLSGVLPTTDDLYMLPVNPSVVNSSLRSCKTVDQSINQLYGPRFHQFFEDALNSGPVADRIRELTEILRQTIHQFNLSNGPYATAALLNKTGDASLPVLFDSFCKDLNHVAKLESIVVPSVGFLRNPVEQRQNEVVQRGGREKIAELTDKALMLLLSKLKSAMKRWQKEYAAKAAALRSAFAQVNAQLSAVFPNGNLTYHKTVKSYADKQNLYPNLIADEDFQLLDRYFSVNDPAASLMKALTQLNLEKNHFITLTMQNAFATLGYTNGSEDLKSALNTFCKAAVFSPVQYVQQEVYILPQNGDWSNGGRVYGLIRLFSMPNNLSLLQSISYLANMAGTNQLTLPAAYPLPSGAMPAPDVEVEEVRVAPREEEEIEPEQPIGNVQYAKPDSILTFAWPQLGVPLITMKINGNTHFGEVPFNKTITVSSTSYLTRGGTVLPDVRLTGRCDREFSWYDNGVEHTSQGWLTVAPVHISRLIVDKGKEYDIQITTSENVPNLSRYLLLQVRKNNGSAVTYRLPDLSAGHFTIDKTHCHGKPEIVLSDPKWSEYFSF